MTVGPVVYVYGPDGKRLKKISASGTTLYLGAKPAPAKAGVELANGMWTKYLHADVKVVGTGGAAVTSWLHRDPSLCGRNGASAKPASLRAQFHECVRRGRRNATAGVENSDRWPQPSAGSYLGVT